MNLDDVKREVALGNRILNMVGLAAGVRASMGHVSLRDPSDPGRFIVKGRGYAIDVLARMQPENMVVCDLEGYLVDGPPGTLQCHEVKIHSCIYKARPDVKSVVHVHPPFSVLLTVLGMPLVPVVLEGVRVVRHPLPVYPHTCLITTEEQGMEVAEALGNANAIHLLGHGAISVGKTMEESVTTMIHLEHQAKMNYHARAVGGPDHARIGEVKTGGSIWADLMDRAARMMDAGLDARPDSGADI
jgi:ribulose-5-phosphate 4-epimerase/fuculose-1-phosphate aldolase